MRTCSSGYRCADAAGPAPESASSIARRSRVARHASGPAAMKTSRPGEANAAPAAAEPPSRPSRESPERSRTWSPIRTPGRGPPPWGLKTPYGRTAGPNGEPSGTGAHVALLTPPDDGTARIPGARADTDTAQLPMPRALSVPDVRPRTDPLVPIGTSEVGCLTLR